MNRADRDRFGSQSMSPVSFLCILQLFQTFSIVCERSKAEIAVNRAVRGRFGYQMAEGAGAGSKVQSKLDVIAFWQRAEIL